MEFLPYPEKDLKINPHIFFLMENSYRLNTKQALLHFFTVCDRPTILGVPVGLIGQQYIRITGKKQELDYLDDFITVSLNKEMVTKDKYSKNWRTLYSPDKDSLVYGVWRHKNDETIAVLIKLQENGLLPIYKTQDQFMLEKGMIESYNGPPIKTDVGKFLLNRVVLANAVGDKIPYMNKKIGCGDTDDAIADLIMKKKIGRKEYNAYIDAAYWLCSEGSIFVPTWSVKSIGTDPRIKKKKEELLAALGDNPNPTRIAEIEKELVEMDKEYLKGDPSEVFWGAVGNSAYTEERKKSWIMFGLTPSFGETGKYEFVAESLEEGWSSNTVAACANDIRRGSYGRGKETAKGGEQTKYVLRIFQNVKVAEDDCGTKKGLPVLITEANYKQYVDRYLMDGKLTTADWLKSQIGKQIVIRSPMYCQTKGFNYCAKCCGEIIRTLGLDAAGMQALDLTGNFTTIAMKSIHKSGITVVEIKDVNQYIVDPDKKK